MFAFFICSLLNVRLSIHDFFITNNISIYIFISPFYFAHLIDAQINLSQVCLLEEGVRGEVGDPVVVQQDSLDTVGYVGRRYRGYP